MADPIRTAAGAIEAATRSPESNPLDYARLTYVDDARVALASLAQHRDDIARVIQSCDANSEPWDDLPGYAREAFRRRADAVLAYLTGEAS